MVKTEVLKDPALAERLRKVFGAPGDSMDAVEKRASELLGDTKSIVWEGDPQTFQFSFVGNIAEELLGYPVKRWTVEPTFWADVVVHKEDRDDAIAFCALATGKCQDHDFVYRAVAHDGRVVWLHDVVKVIRGPRGVAERLRGIMMDITPEVERSLADA